ncbi:hypothetical protein TYRP_017044 [Tyrophagus putrescentiae]|nr:hypothetical protein TYRP_017044 [Tyrophagus putrescentiae]
MAVVRAELYAVQSTVDQTMRKPARQAKAKVATKSTELQPEKSAKQLLQLSTNSDTPTTGRNINRAW